MLVSSELPELMGMSDRIIMLHEGRIGGEFERSLVAMTPLGRIGTPADIAKIAAFLASDDSGWLTGEVILASGGLR